MGKEKSVFDKFTGKYQLSKTLRFELKPIGKTEEFLKTNKVFEKDQTIDDSYNQAKFYFDTLHQKFINSALGSEKVKNFSLKNFADILNKQNEIISEKKIEIKELRKKDKKNSKIKKLQKEINDAERKIEDKKKEIYKAIRVLFDAEANQWKDDYQKKEINGEKIEFGKADLKQKGVDFLTVAGILKVLKYEFPKEKENEFKAKGWPSLYVEEKENPGKKRYIFESFDKFSGYLSKFQQTRKNLYVNDGTSTAVATRIVDNLVIFLQNKKVFDEKYKTNYSQIGPTETNIFNLEYYKNCLLQKGIEALAGEKDSENSYNKIIGGINEKSKEFRDQKEQEAKKNKTNFKKSDYPLLKILDKQILGKVEKEKQLIEKTKDKAEEEILVVRFREFIQNNEVRFKNARGLMNVFFVGGFDAEYLNIYLKNRVINTISRRWFANWRDFELKLPQRGSKKKDEKDEPKIKKFISIDEIKGAVEQPEGDIFKEDYYKNGVIQKEKNNSQQNKWEQFLRVWQYEFDNLFKDIKKENGELILGYADARIKEARGLKTFSRKNKGDIAKVKNYADAALSVYQMLKYFALDDKDRENAPGQLSTNFYAQYDEYYKDFEFIKYYNAFRNFITQKPFDENKIKLNFENEQLLTGFDKNKEKEKIGIILRKDGIYYLGIMNKNYNTIFDEKQHSEAYLVNGNNYYEKMEYKFFPDPKRMIPKIAFAAENRKAFGWTQEIQNIKDDYGKFQKKKKGNRDTWKEQFDKNKTTRLIAYYQQCLERGGYKKTFNFLWKTPDAYVGIGEFNDDIARQNYFIRFVNVAKDYVDAKVEKGELYLFQIYSKDFSIKASGVKNIHSLYFLNLFNEENIDNLVLKLSGNAEVFYRKKSLEPKKEKRNFPREITKYKRYTEPKIFFHVPISINTNAGSSKRFNQEINKRILSQSKEIRVIGIDRGEKNLLYYSVVNQKGEILGQRSLNKIKIGKKEVDFYDKLVIREKERLKNRQSWEPVQQIKDLKKGYISQAVRKICDLVIEHNAIVVLEDLNMRFKQIRGGIERSVYQQFEKALIDKLGYMVFKDDRDLRSPGGILNGYQLAAPFVSFNKMGKQTGILFYTQANYTSITDPFTGFRKNIYISNGASQEKIRQAFEKMEIGWDDKGKSYFFKYDVKDFSDQNNENIQSKEWIVYAKIPRIRREKDSSGYWQYESIDVNKKLEDLFYLWGFDRKEDIAKQIIQKEKNGELKGEKEFDGKPRNFYKALIYYFNLILQLRNSFSKKFKVKESNGKVEIEEIGEDIDFIASPVKPFFSTKVVNKKGEVLSPLNFAEFEKRFIGSRENKRKFIDEYNADANGAYNIARKGIMLLKEISKNPEKPDLYVTKQDWDEFTQGQYRKGRV